jgi:hypothetical protein
MGSGLSVAMITFNGERYLREQVESILTQSTLPDELVIGDDGSTDGTRSLIDQLADQSVVPIRVVGGDHVGLRLNVQRTMEACRGGVIILSDQDDVWLPGKITAVREAFADSTVTLWFSDAEMSDESGVPRGDRLWEHVSLQAEQQAVIAGGDGLTRLIHGMTVTGATMAFRSDLCSLVLPLPTELELGDHIYLHDGWIAVRAYLMGRTAMDPVPRVRYRQHGQQVTKSASPRSQGAAHRMGLVPDGALSAEYARTRLVLSRLNEQDALTKCRPGDATTLLNLDTLLCARTMPPGAARVGAILRELARGNYARFARGWRTAGGDLFLRHGIPVAPREVAG